MKYAKWIVSLLGVALLAIALVWSRGAEEGAPPADAASERVTANGPVVGFADDLNTHAWLGVPYAASTGGENRWRAPQPVTDWLEPRLALEHGNACPQPWSITGGSDGSSGDLIGSEDCLVLNIWAPRFTPGGIPRGEDALPVMVWIHGGSNRTGTANAYPAAALAGSEGVIVVGINYRLGVLGWFSDPLLRAAAADPLDASGNFGTLDTIEALRWVRQNIASFGGDPERVTVFGESAGGRNVYMLMASPLASGLFHRAIVQSGSLYSMPLTLAENAVDAEHPGHAASSTEEGVRLLQRAGLAADRDQALALRQMMEPGEWATFLRNRSLQELLDLGEGRPGTGSVPQTFRDGVVLPHTPLTEVFADPEQYNAVPLITGANRDEQKLFMAMNPRFADNWFGIIPRIRDQEEYDRVSAYYSDRWRLSAVDAPATIMQGGGAPEVYAYRFDWDEGGSLGLVDWSEALGAAHGMEIPFVFSNFESIFPLPRLFTAGNRAGRKTLSRQMMGYWAEFARNGYPGSGDAPRQPQWLPFGDTGQVMFLDSPEDGGLQLRAEPLRVADIRRRIAADEAFSSPRERCWLFADLFYSPYRGKEYFDPLEYRELGCQSFDPQALLREGLKES